MSPRELLLHEIEQASDSLLREVLSFFLFLKARYPLNDHHNAAAEPEEVVLGSRTYSLRGLPVRLDSPFEPVAEEDWDATGMPTL